MNTVTVIPPTSDHVTGVELMHDLQVDQSKGCPVKKIGLFREDDFLLGQRRRLGGLGVVQQLLDLGPKGGGPLHEVEGVDRVKDVALGVVRPCNHKRGRFIKWNSAL